MKHQQHLKWEEITYSKETKSIVTEMSDVMAMHTAHLWGKRLTNIEWYIHSGRTNVVAVFEYDSEMRLNEELIGWVFKPTLATWTHHPHLAPFRFLIYND